MNAGVDPLPEPMPEPEIGFDDEPFGDPVHDVSVELPLEETVELQNDAQVPLDVEPDTQLGETIDFDDISVPIDEQHETELPGAKSPTTRTESVEIQKLRADLEHAIESRDALTQQLRDVQDRLESATPAGEITRIESELRTAQKHRDEAEAELRSVREELTRIQSTLAEVTEIEVTPEAVDDDTQTAIDLVDAQIRALQTENEQLRGALKEAQGAESRTESAHDRLQRKIDELESDIEVRESVEQVKEEEILALKRQVEKLGLELAEARKVSADNIERAEELSEKEQSLTGVETELTTLREETASLRLQLADYDAAKERVHDLETELEQVNHALHEAQSAKNELEERVDTEAARSYRLSKRRIPALNKEIEELTESNRELERKIQKLTLQAETFEERAKEQESRANELQSALTAAKARAQDTQMLRPDSSDDVLDDELRRVSNQLRDVQTERQRLAQTISELENLQRENLRKSDARSDRMATELDEALNERDEIEAKFIEQSAIIDAIRDCLDDESAIARIKRLLDKDENGS